MRNSLIKRIAVIPNDPIASYLAAGFGEKWLKEYFNPMQFFDEVYALSPYEKDNSNLLGMQAIHTSITELHKRLKELKIDLVRAYGGFFPCEMACRNKVNGIPVIVSVHDTNPARLCDWIDKTDVVWCMSQAVKKLVLTKYKKEDRVWLLPNRVNFNVMRPYLAEEVKDLNSRYPFKYKILHVGRKTKQKNLDNLIKALKILGPEYCLLAVGKGDFAEYEKIVKEQGVSKNCFLIEAIKNEDLPRYFSWADCMCMPSRWEGFSIVIIEALAAGAVLVASDIPEIAEAIQDRRNGVLIKNYENPQAIAEMIRLACTDQGLRQTIKDSARKSVERFEQSKVDALEVEYYKKVIALNAQGEFRMPLLEQMASTTLGRGIRGVIPVSVKKAMLNLISHR